MNCSCMILPESQRHSASFSPPGRESGTWKRLQNKSLSLSNIIADSDVRGHMVGMPLKALAGHLQPSFSGLI